MYELISLSGAPRSHAAAWKARFSGWKSGKGRNSKLDAARHPYTSYIVCWIGATVGCISHVDGLGCGVSSRT